MPRHTRGSLRRHANMRRAPRQLDRSYDANFQDCCEPLPCLARLSVPVRNSRSVVQPSFILPELAKIEPGIGIIWHQSKRLVIMVFRLGKFSPGRERQAKIIVDVSLFGRNGKRPFKQSCCIFELALGEPDDAKPSMAPWGFWVRPLLPGEGTSRRSQASRVDGRQCRANRATPPDLGSEKESG